MKPPTFTGYVPLNKEAEENKKCHLQNANDTV